jgi:3-phenylpropionate/trans-cinnamate dioxygenase ferredoxin subunit
MALNFVKVARKGDVPAGRVKVVVVGGERIALCNVEGEVFAVSDVCTHDGGPLGEGELQGEVIECPRHGARFNVRTGQVLALPAVFPLKTYPVRIQGEDIEVGIKAG